MSAKYPTKLRRHQPRSRRGCLTCRLRKKKCDETRPTCLACQRNKIDCAWPLMAPDSGSPSSSASPASSRPSAGGRLDDGPNSSSILQRLSRGSHGRHGRRSSWDTNNSDDGAGPGDTPTAAWSPDRCAFVPMAPSTGPSAVGLTPLSTTLLRYFIVETVPMLTTTAHAAHNPFLADVLPLAYTDDLVMHCVLALGGAQLSSCMLRRNEHHHHYDGSGGGAPSPWVSAPASASSSSMVPMAAGDPHTMPQDAALLGATVRHYTCVVRSLRRAALGALRPDDAPQVLRLLLVLLLLARYEGLSWNALGGGVLAHLRACRQLLVLLREEEEDDDNDTDGEVALPSARRGGAAGVRPRRLSHDERTLLGALLEVYAYLVLVNRVCPEEDQPPRGGVEDEYDDDDGNDDDDEDFVVDPGRLADQPYFGLLFSGLHGLFAQIGPLTRLATRIQRDGCVSAASAARTRVLRARIDAWRLAPPPLPGARPPTAAATAPAGSQDLVWQRALGEVYRHALLIYLECMCLRIVGGDEAWAACFVGHDSDDSDDDSQPGDPYYDCMPVEPPAIRPHTYAIGQAILCTCLPVSRFGPVLLWPLVIAGSAFVSPGRRRALSQGLRGVPVWETAFAGLRNGTKPMPAVPPPWPLFAATGLAPPASATSSTPSAAAAAIDTANTRTWGMVRCADVLEALWQRHDAAVRDAAFTPPPADGAPLGWHAYYGPHGMARLLRETNIRPCIW